jgi:hypothetical protein
MTDAFSSMDTRGGGLLDFENFWDGLVSLGVYLAEDRAIAVFSAAVGRAEQAINFSQF